MCAPNRFMIGNDFVPALPALDIRLGALELLLEIHTETFAESGSVSRSVKTMIGVLRVLAPWLLRQRPY